MRLSTLEHFRRNLREAIKASGNTQNDIAGAAGIHFISLSRILHGHRNPTVDTCERLATAVGIPLAELLQGPKKTSAAR